MDLNSFLTTFSIAAIPVIFAITLHEVAHGWVAKSFGDRTAEMQGRLSLNPIRHIDPVGTILVPALLLAIGGFMFGWAKPVPVDPRNLRDPRPNMAVVSFAGPAANFAMALAWGFVMVIAQDINLGAASEWLILMGAYGITFNIAIGLLNLIPIPPLDGGQLLQNLLPVGPLTELLDRIRPFGFLIVLIMIPTGVLSFLLAGPMNFLVSLVKSIFDLRGFG